MKEKYFSRLENGWLTGGIGVWVADCSQEEKATLAAFVELYIKKKRANKHEAGEPFDYAYSMMA